jgi:hypothetical protein
MTLETPKWYGNDGWMAGTLLLQPTSIAIGGPCRHPWVPHSLRSPWAHLSAGAMRG